MKNIFLFVCFIVGVLLTVVLTWAERMAGVSEEQQMDPRFR